MRDPSPLTRLLRRWPLLSVVLAVAAIVALIPFEDPPPRLADGLVVTEVVVFLVVACAVALHTPPRYGSEAPPTQVRFIESLIPLLVYPFWVAFWQRELIGQGPVLDDAVYLAVGDRPRTLLAAHNEHCVLLPKAFTLGVLVLGRACLLEPLVLGKLTLFGIFLPVLYRAYRRLSGSVLGAVAGLALVAFWPGLREVVGWYSATLWLIPVVLFLWALPSAWHGGSLWPSLIAAALGPLAFWIGLLAGPLLAWCRLIGRDRGRSYRDALAIVVATALGTAIAGGIVFFTGRGQGSAFLLANMTVWKRATVFAGRYLVDHTVRPVLGELPGPEPFQYPLHLALLLGAVAAVLLTARMRVGVLLPVWMVILSYGIVFPTRADLVYEPALRTSDRYHLWAQVAFGWMVAWGIGQRTRWPGTAWFGREPAQRA